MLLERLLDNLALSVEMFATCSVASGWRLRLPALDWVTLHFVVQGAGSVRDQAGRTTELPVGSLVVVPAGVVHSLEFGPPPHGEAAAHGEARAGRALPELRAGPAADDTDDLIVVCGRIAVMYGALGLFDQLRELLVVDFSDDRLMRATFDRILDEVRRGRPGSKAMTATLLRECLIRVFRELCEDDECTVSWLSALDDPTLATVVEAMLDHPEQPHTVASLASRAYMSRSAFARRFRESFGQPPLEYLRGIRLRRAAQLLKQAPPLPVPVVARRSGFSSRSQFSRAFRSYFGCSPTEFRA